MPADRYTHGTFFGVVALLFIVSAAITVVWCRSMSAMAEMPMPGGWHMSMTWMLMPGQSQIVATISFLVMWDVMMLAMMIPSLIPMLLSYRQLVGKTNTRRLGWLTALTGLGYFFVWTIIGLIVFPVGIGINAIFMRHRDLSLIVPGAVGVIILVVGLLQLTKWKRQQLACCQVQPFCDKTTAHDFRTAWKHGLHLGIQCYRCTAGLMLILLVTGTMNPLIMAMITTAISIERLLPGEKRVADIIGIVTVGIGCFLIARAAGIF